MRTPLPHLPRLIAVVRRTSRQWSAVLSLLAFQVAPLQVTTDSTGRLEFAVGFGAERYLQQRFDCDGNPVATRRVTAKLLSGLVEYHSRNDLRIAAFGGSVEAMTHDCLVVSAQYTCSLDPPFSGGFGGAMVAKEWRRFGLGGGVTVLPPNANSLDITIGDSPSSSKLHPAGYLRLGSRERTALVLDINSVRATGTVPLSSLGLSFGSKGATTERGYIGFGVLPYFDVGDQTPIALVGRAAIPLRSNGDLTVGALLGAGELVNVQIGTRWRVNMRR